MFSNTKRLKRELESKELELEQSKKLNNDFYNALYGVLYPQGTLNFGTSPQRLINIAQARIGKEILSKRIRQIVTESLYPDHPNQEAIIEKALEVISEERGLKE